MTKHNKVKMYSNGTCMHISIDGVELNHVLSAEIKKGGSYPKLLLEIECDIETLNKEEYKKKIQVINTEIDEDDLVMFIRNYLNGSLI